MPHPTKNILFSTSRMWNCGDDFILFGVQNLLDDILPSYNSLVFNRNPDFHLPPVQLDQKTTLNISGAGQQNLKVPINLYQMVEKYLYNNDNSWRYKQHDLSFVDVCIFAGTPEWRSPATYHLSQALLKTDIPLIYLGIGSYERIKDWTYDQLQPEDQQLTKKAKLITVRDETCAKILEPVTTKFLPCPALFSTKENSVRKGKKRIALSTQGLIGSNGQHISRDVFDYSVELFKRLNEEYECALVCHYIDELKELKGVFGSEMPLLYSYDSREYEHIYNDFDLTVTTRVHGAGICASLGIPGVVLAHSDRSVTAEGFLAELIQVGTTSIDDAVAVVNNISIEEKSAQLLKHKESVRQEYLTMLKACF